MGTNNGKVPTGTGGNFKEEKTDSRGPKPSGRESVSTVAGVSAVIELVIQAGAYISFSAAGDGGAIRIRILDGPIKLTSYVHTIVEFQEALHSIRQRYKEYMPNEGLLRTT